MAKIVKNGNGTKPFAAGFKGKVKVGAPVAAKKPPQPAIPYPVTPR